MLTDFNNKINPDFLKWETAISEVEKLCDARIAFYEESQKFDMEATFSEFESHLKSLSESFARGLTPKNGDRDIQDIQHDNDFYSTKISQYQHVKNLIAEKLGYQDMVDNLYFHLFMAYEEEKAHESIFDSIRLDLTKKAINTRLESHFFVTLVSILEPLISAAQIDFIKDYSFKFTPKVVKTGAKKRVMIIRTTDTNMKRKHLLVNKINALSRRIIKLDSEWPKEEDFLIKYRENANSIVDLWNKLNFLMLDMHSKHAAYDNVERDELSENLRYRELHCAYFKLLDAAEEFEECYVRLAVPDKNTDDFLVLPQPKKPKQSTSKKTKHKQKPKKKKQKNKQPTKDKGTIILPAVEVKATALIAVDDKIAEKTIEVAPLPPQKKEDAVDAFALKTRTWIDEVARRKKEKQDMADRKLQEEREHLDAQRKEKQYYLAHKEEIDYQNARQLLEKLNPRNLVLIEHMFEKPTPHCEIRYHDIEELFGQESGKLPGAITSVSGSHRKIVIQNTIGFFDELSISDNADTDTPPILPMYQGFQQKQENHEVVGGTFKAHGRGQGGSKLPSIAIKLVCSTLERAGITAANIERYRKENTGSSKRLSL